MYTIDSTNKKIVFTYSKSTLFEDLKMTSALKAQQIVSKEGTDLSDMFIITDDELGYMGRWLEATLPYITSAIPQQHLTTSVDSMNIIVTAHTDTTRALSEGNIISADGMLRNLIIFGCLAEWYSTVNQLDFQQEYATKMAEHLKVFTETLFDSRKRKVGTLFSIADGTGAKSITVADQINALQTLVTALQTLVAAQGQTINTQGQAISSSSAAIESLDSRTTDNEGDIATEISRAQTAEQGILNTVQEWISESMAKLTVKVNVSFLAASTAFSSSALRAASAASTLARTSLASLPTCGRSSGASLPMPFMAAVSEPFLPVTAMRICSSASSEPAFLRPSSASAWMALRSSRIDMSFSSLLPRRGNKKPPLTRCQGRIRSAVPPCLPLARCLSRATTR